VSLLIRSAVVAGYALFQARVEFVWETWWVWVLASLPCCCSYMGSFWRNSVGLCVWVMLWCWCCYEGWVLVLLFLVQCIDCRFEFSGFVFDNLIGGCGWSTKYYFVNLLGFNGFGRMSLSFCIQLVLLNMFFFISKRDWIRTGCFR